MSLVSYIVYRAELTSDAFRFLLDYPAGSSSLVGDLHEQFPWLQIATVRGGASGYRDFRFVDGTAVAGRKYLYRVTCRTTDQDGRILAESPGRILPGYLLTKRLKTRHQVTHAQSLFADVPWNEVTFNLPSKAEIDEPLIGGEGVPSVLRLGPDRENVYVESTETVPSSGTYEVTYTTEAAVEYGYALEETPGTTEQWLYSYRPTEGSSTMWRLLWAGLPTTEPLIEEFFTVQRVHQAPLSYVEFKTNIAEICLTLVNQPEGQTYQIVGTQVEGGPDETANTQIFFPLADDEDEGGAERNAMSLATSLALSGLFNLMVDGSKVYISYRQGSTAIVVTEEPDSPDSSFYNPDEVEVYSACPTIMAISHGGNQVAPHVGATQDVVTFPYLENRSDILLYQRSFGGQNNDPETYDPWANPWLWFLLAANPADGDEITIGIEGDVLIFEFLAETDETIYGQRIDAVHKVLIASTLKLTMENLVNYYNGLRPSDQTPLRLSTGTLPHGSAVGVYLTSRTSDPPVLETVLAVTTDTRPGCETYCEETGYLRLEDADQSAMGEWSGGGFNQTRGHFHLDYDLSIGTGDNPDEVFVTVDGKIVTLLSIDQPQGQLVIGCGEIQLFADGTTKHLIRVVKHYPDGSTVMAGCVKILPRRGMLEPIGSEHHAVVVRNDALDANIGVAGWITGPFDGDNIQVQVSDDSPAEASGGLTDLGTKSGTDHRDARLLHFAVYDTEQTTSYRLRNVLLNGLDSDGLYSPGEIGCVSAYTSWSEVVHPTAPALQCKIEASYKIVFERENPGDDNAVTTSLTRYADLSSGLFSWLMNFQFPRTEPYPPSGGGEYVIYSRTAKLYPSDEKCSIQSVSIGSTIVVPVDGSGIQVPGKMVSIKTFESTGGEIVGANQYFTTYGPTHSNALVLNDFFFAMDGDAPPVLGKVLSDGKGPGVSFINGDSAAEASVKPTPNYLSFDRMGRTYDMVLKTGTFQTPAAPSVKIFKKQKTVLVRTPITLPTGVTRLSSQSGPYPLRISPNSRVSFAPILADLIPWMDRGTIYLCLDLGDEVVPDICLISVGEDVVGRIDSVVFFASDFDLTQGFSLVSGGRDYELRAAYLSSTIVTWSGKLFRDGVEISDFQVDPTLSTHEIDLPTVKGNYTVLLYPNLDLESTPFFFIQSPTEEIPNFEGPTYTFNFQI